MWTSLSKLIPLPDHTQVYCGHEVGGGDFGARGEGVMKGPMILMMMLWGRMMLMFPPEWRACVPAWLPGVVYNPATAFRPLCTHSQTGNTSHAEQAPSFKFEAIK